MRSVSQRKEQVRSWIITAFFFIFKTITVVMLILAGGLIISQSAVSPVSARFLSTYAVEYTAKTIKPYRHFFPKPYMVQVEEKTR